jgi:hypothetical protein
MKQMTLCLALVSAVTLGVSAQTTRTTSEAKIKVKDGRNVKVTGCVQSTTGAPGYMLTNIVANGGDKDDVVSGGYLLVGESNELSKHVGHMVEIKGKAVDKDDGKLQVTTKTKVDVDNADDRETRTKSEVSGDLAGLPFLGVKSVKMIRASCN